MSSDAGTACRREQKRLEFAMMVLSRQNTFALCRADKTQRRRRSKEEPQPLAAGLAEQHEKSRKGRGGRGNAGSS